MSSMDRTFKDNALNRLFARDDIETDSRRDIHVRRRMSLLAYERFHRRLDEIEAELSQLEAQLSSTDRVRDATLN